MNRSTAISLPKIKLKAFTNNTWDWIEFDLRKTDVNYILRRCTYRRECTPFLRKRGKVWSLDFPFEEVVKLNNTNLKERRIVSVDLGLNNACTCSVMTYDGTVVGREFHSLPSEYDCLNHALGRVGNAQRSGHKRMPKLWAKVRGINKHISVLTAEFIQDVAIKYDADVVVMEHLNIGGKKRGGKKQRLHHWRAHYVQSLVEHKCHRLGMRVSRVNPCNTSALAYDGSGPVLRGKKSQKTCGNHSLCEFSNGKVYNCDLNASYNIGARYFIREILGSMPEKARLEAEAKVPSLSHRSTCTLSTLYDLRAVVDCRENQPTERIMSEETRESDAPQGQPHDNLCVALGSTRL